MIYPYTCPRCQTKFTVELSVSVYEKIGKNITCPMCKNSPAKRDLTAVAVHYVGDGFTKTVREE